MLDRHKNAIRQNDEFVYVSDNAKHLTPEEKTKFWQAVRVMLDAEIQIHELYILVNDRVKRCGK